MAFGLLAGHGDGASARAAAEVRILAPFPADPGFPEGIAIRGGRVYVSGAASIASNPAGPSTVMAFDRATGAVLARYDAVGEDLTRGHGNSGIAFDRRGRLYVLNAQLGTYRLVPKTGARAMYAPPLPDLKPCVVAAGPPCSPTPLDQAPQANDLAFAPSGDAFVSDSQQATIWRIPAGGGKPRIWFQDRRLATAFVGANGLRVDHAARRLYVVVTLDLAGASLVYSLPLVRRPAARRLTLVHRFAVGDLPDGIAFGARGDLYVAIASPTAPGIVILRPDGSQRARLRNPLASPFAPFDGPANIAFDGAGRILLTNHAPATGELLRRFSIADADVGDTGARLFTPTIR
jgi:sugar lactone lactonase YvrE